MFKVRSKILSLLLTAAVVISMFAGLTITASAAASGNWTDSGNYYTGWYNATDTTFTLTKEADLAGLAYLVNEGTDTFAGKTINLVPTAGTSLDLSAHYWVPIGGASPLVDGKPSGNYFAGTFNGAVSGGTYGTTTINGMFIQPDDADTITNNSGYGLFGYVNGGSIWNISISSITTGGAIDLGKNPISCAGGIVGYTNGTVYNAHNFGVNITVGDPGSSMTGGIAGTVENSDPQTTILVQYCSNGSSVIPQTGGYVTGGGRVGGIVGAVYCASTGGVLIDNCINALNTVATISSTQRAYVGGIVGYCRGFITNSYSYNATIQTITPTPAGHYLGGVAGLLQGTSPQAAMSNVYAHSTFAGTYSASTDHGLYASADNSNSLKIGNSLWDATNVDIVQPTATPGSGWGDWTNVGQFASTPTANATTYTTSTQATQSVNPLSGVLNATPIISGVMSSAYSASVDYPRLAWETTTPPLSPTAITLSADDQTQIFLDGTAATNGSGTPSSPFNNITSALAALGGAKRIIYVVGTVQLSSNTTISTSVPSSTIIRSDKFGGALFSVTGGTTTLQSIVIDGNTTNIAATSALINVAGGTLEVDSGTQLQNNSGHQGGAINLSSGTVNVNAGTISGNIAYSGGAIYMSGGTLTISGGSISNNSVTTTISGATAALGGAVYASGGTTTVSSGAIISGNKAITSQSAGPAEGGAFYITNSGTTVSVTGGTITNNGVQVGTGSGGGITATAQGGAFYVTSAGALTISGGVVSYNSANYTSTSTNGSGGAIYLDTTGTATITGGIFNGNQAGQYANGIFVSASNTLTLSPASGAGLYFGTSDVIYLASEVSFAIGTDLSQGMSAPVSITFADAVAGDVVAVTPSLAIATASLGRLSVTSPNVLGVTGNNIVLDSALRTTRN